MKRFFEKYQGYILPLILIIIFVMYTVFTWGKWGHSIYDCFREAVIPGALLDGKVLYRDITNLYPPLGYQFNALLYLIFGNSLNTLYFAGILNSFLILSIIYFIVKKYSTNLTAFITVLSITEIFTFRICSTGTTAAWFFPYSYSFIYAFSTCLLSLLACILYKENSKQPVYLYLAFLFAGLSIAFKFDFILFALVPVFFLIKSLKEDFKGKGEAFKRILTSILCLTLPFIVSILIYLTTGGDAADLENEVKFLADFSNAPSVIAFNKGAMPQSFKVWVLNKVFISFEYFLLTASIIFLYTLFSAFIVSKVKNYFAKIFLGAIFCIFGLSTVIKYGAYIQYSVTTLHTSLSFVSYFVTISAVLIFIFKAVKNKGFRGLQFTRDEKFYFFITFCAALMSFRSFASLHISNIGNFIIAIWWVNFVYFFLQLLPSYFPSLFKKGLIKKTFNLLFILYALCFTYIYLYDAGQMTYKITDKKGVFYNSEKYSPAIIETVNFINNNIPKDKTFLVSEEGLIFNYLCQRSANLKYYALIPHMIDTFGEENVIKDLGQNPPDYILIGNNIYVTKKLGGVFGLDYAKKIAKFIVKNYDYITTISGPDRKDSFSITVFKLKNLN